MSILRSKHSGWTWEGRRTPFGGGGGGQPSAPTQQTVTQTNIPSYAEPYVTDMLGRAQALTTQSTFQPYSGQMVAGFTPMQAQAFQNVANQGVAGQIGEASNLASQVGRTALGAFGQGQQLGQQALGYGAQGTGYGALGAGYGGAAAGMSGMGFGAGQRFEQMATSPGAQAAYMSPYMQNVVDFQKQQALRDYGIAQTGRQAQATAAGAFGGSRQAVQEAEANRALMNQMAGIQATGTQKAFEDAQRQMQFGADLGLRGLSAGYQGLGMGIQGAQAGMQGAGVGLQGVGQAVGAGQYGLAGLGQAGSAASTLGALGQTQFQQESAINEAMARAGQQQQALQQRGLEAQYQQYLDSLNYPYKQIGFMSDILRGLPLSQGTSSIYQAPPSMLSQIGGAGLGLYGASKLFKKGGPVKKQGSGLTDIQLHRLVGK